MTDEDREAFRQDARFIFYHGLDSYREHAWPEDELRPLSCGPLTRDRANPAHVEVNDVLGNYSLSVVDSLSTLAILASDPLSKHDDHNALIDFQQYVSLLVDEYGDGSSGPSGQGHRARGFDLDSKVQVFETTIRGVGGLLSAHLFAMGHLPIRGYSPQVDTLSDGREAIRWDVQTARGQQFIYDGQLLRLAHDMGKRLLPAFHTSTGIPYPRVNLKHGTPFYENSPLNNDAEHGQCEATQTPKAEREITETCSAGSASLVLEFTVLSRLTGDVRFENLAKKAFFAIWDRRTAMNLVGAGIDAETGNWVSPFTGIGAGIDSFFEYAFKSHILLSGLETQSTPDDEPTSSNFLETWDMAHAAISRHLYRGAHFGHPHYSQNDMWTGGARYLWIDSLSAYYPGLLTLAGEVEEATATHLLHTALWERYGALPERWNTFTGRIDAGLRWWGGRPEFIESTWYLYRATNDPWYLHVGEMVIKDIRTRCWTACGWAGLQDVRTGEQIDRQESFFLGETAKYLYLLFDPNHPLNHLDAPFVFTTEGHPLIIPKAFRPSRIWPDADPVYADSECPAPPAAIPLTISNVASRPDFFHAASLARLGTAEPMEVLINNETRTTLFPTLDHIRPRAPNDRTFYPWSLPNQLIPNMAQSAPKAVPQTSDLTFPLLPDRPVDLAGLQRTDRGILIKSISGLRLGLVMDEDPQSPGNAAYRIYALSNFALGRDEKLLLSPEVFNDLDPADANFSRLKDTHAIDLIVDVPAPPEAKSAAQESSKTSNDNLLSVFAGAGLDLQQLGPTAVPADVLLSALPSVLLQDGAKLADQLDSLAALNFPSVNLDQAIRDAASTLRSRLIATPAPSATQPAPTLSQATYHRYAMAAMLPSGPGAAPLPVTRNNPAGDDMIANAPAGDLTYKSILVVDSDLCGPSTLPRDVPSNYQVLVMRRGGCSFGDKIRNIPSHPPSEASLKLIVAISFPDQEKRDSPDQSEQDASEMARKRSRRRRHVPPAQPEFSTRPYIEYRQFTRAGVERLHPLCLVMASGGQEAWELFERASVARAWTDDKGLWRVQGKGIKSSGEQKEQDQPAQSGGLGIKRRYWFASNGVRITNLFMA